MCSAHGEFEDDEKWAFRSPVWDCLGLENVVLEQVHRQTDLYFTRMLCDCRKGIAWTAQQEHDLLNNEHDVDRDKATRLVPTRHQADLINSCRLSQISCQARVYKAVDHFRWYPEDYPEMASYKQRVDENQANSPLKVLDHHRFPAELELKAGMLVLLLSNLSHGEGLVNGSIGTVLGFAKVDRNTPNTPGGPEETWADGATSGAHKGYQDARIKDFKARDGESRCIWPLIQFKNGLKRIISANCMVHEHGSGIPSLLSRTQLPLIAGYALTIHKSQGMTMDSVMLILLSAGNADKLMSPCLAQEA